MVNENFADKVGPRLALIVYDTKFGNTQKIAEALQVGLRKRGIETTCVDVGHVALESLKIFDLMVVGAPTQTFSASKSMKEFLGQLSTDLSGKFAFAFDTKYKNCSLVAPRNT